MDRIQDIIKNHSKICTCEKMYEIGTDVQINVRQKEDYIFMFAYNKVKCKNMSIYTNYKRIYNSFKKMSNSISQDKDYNLRIYLKENINKIETTLNYEYIEKTEIEKLKENILMLIAENKQLKNENEVLKIKIEECSQIKMNIGRKNKFDDKHIQEIKMAKVKYGKSIRQIAKEYKCSVGLVHKLINEQEYKPKDIADYNLEDLYILESIQKRNIKELAIDEKSILYKSYLDTQKRIKELEQNIVNEK